MRLSKSVAAAVAAAAALAAAAPASAATITTNTRAVNLGNPTSTTSSYYAFECTAASADAVGIYINKCYLEGLNSGLRYHATDTGSKPGSADVRAGTAHAVHEPFQICVQATALMRDSVFQSTPLTCSTN